jgi:hypothetical protein
MFTSESIVARKILTSSFTGLPQDFRHQFLTAVKASDVCQIIKDGFHSRNDPTALCFDQNTQDARDVNAQPPRFLAGLTFIQNEQIRRQFLRKRDCLSFTRAEFLTKR